MMVESLGRCIPSTWSSNDFCFLIFFLFRKTRLESVGAVSGFSLTFGQAVHDSKRKHRPPSVGFFDDHVDVRKLGEIRPLGGSVLANRSIDFGLGSVSSSACTIWQNGQTGMQRSHRFWTSGYCVMA